MKLMLVHFHTVREMYFIAWEKTAFMKEYNQYCMSQFIKCMLIFKWEMYFNVFFFKKTN